MYRQKWEVGSEWRVISLLLIAIPTPQQAAPYEARREGVRFSVRSEDPTARIPSPSS